jgi:hypothetical protein
MFVSVAVARPSSATPARSRRRGTGEHGNVRS